MDQFINHPLYKKHDIDSAMSSLWAFYKKRFVPLFLVSLVMSLVTQYATTLMDMSELQSITDPEVMISQLSKYIWPMILISLVTLFFSTILHYYVIYNPIDSSNNIFVSALKSLRYFVLYLIIMVLFAFAGSFALVLGLLALVVGVFFAALYLATLYFFILPILMVEGPLIANAIKRTFVLAHRNFWSNFGWSAAFIVILLVVSVLLSGLILLPFTGTFLKAFTDQGSASSLIDLAGNPFYIFLSAAVNALTFPLVTIFACILYFNGRAQEQVPVPVETKADEEKL